MKSKLEELARKEEELRRINDALDHKKNQILAGVPVEEEQKRSAVKDDEDASNDSDDQFKGKNLGGAAAADDDEDDYGDGNFENDLSGTGKSSKVIDDPIGKFEMKMQDEFDDLDIAATVAAGRRA